jgi:hypothetical protein
MPAPMPLMPGFSASLAGLIQVSREVIAGGLP